MNTPRTSNFSLLLDASPIAIHDMERGLASLECILSMYGRACLLCACECVTTCHRLVVAKEAARRFGLSLVHLPVTGKQVA